MFLGSFSCHGYNVFLLFEYRLFWTGIMFSSLNNLRSFVSVSGLEVVCLEF